MPQLVTCSLVKEASLKEASGQTKVGPTHPLTPVGLMDRLALFRGHKMKGSFLELEEALNIPVICTAN